MQATDRLQTGALRSSEGHSGSSSVEVGDLLMIVGPRHIPTRYPMSPCWRYLITLFSANRNNQMIYGWLS